MQPTTMNRCTTIQTVTSRRSFLRGAAMFAGAGALTLATLGLPALGGRPASASAAFTSDVDALQYLLRLEQMAYALYRDALWQFGIDEHNEDRPLPISPSLQRIRDQEREHIEMLSAAITTAECKVAPTAACAFGYTDFAGFLAVAVEVTSTLVDAYTGAATELGDGPALTLVRELLATETRHAAYLQSRIGGVRFSVNSDLPRMKAEIDAVASRFIAS